MDRSKISVGEMIAVGSGLVLIIALLLDWFGTLTAWQAFDLVDFILTLIALSAIAIALGAAAGADLGLPRAAIAGLGAVALVIALTFLFEGEDRGIGLFLGLLAAIGLTYGGLRAMNEASSGAGAPSRRPRPDAGRGAGPSQGGAGSQASPRRREPRERRP